MQRNNPFLSEYENKLNDDYISKGFFVGKIQKPEKIKFIRNSLIDITKKELNIKGKTSNENFLDHVHRHVSPNKLNDFRLKMIEEMNSLPNFREDYYKVVKTYLDSIVGNEVSMQRRVNLSIQLPEDDSSLLPIHADTWSGNSPYEVVIWIPLVDCFDTKSMYILPSSKYSKIQKSFKTMHDANTDELFEAVEEDLEWIEIKFGEVLIFNQSLPHGNRINLEGETRWSMNCRFKSIFTPYGDKKIGEFFEPITLKPASIYGLKYNFPEVG